MAKKHKVKTGPCLTTFPNSQPLLFIKFVSFLSTSTGLGTSPAMHAEKSLSSSIDDLHRLSRLTTLEKTPKRRRRKKRDENAEWKAVIVGIFLGGALAALQLQEPTPRWSQVPESLFVITHVVAVLLVTAALTERAREGLLGGAVAAISQFLTVLGFYSYSYAIEVAIAVVPYQSLRILMYPAAGVIGGYVGSRTGEARSVEPSRDIRRTKR